VRTVLAKPGVEYSPDLPRGLRRVSERTHKSQTRRSATDKGAAVPPAGGTRFRVLREDIRAHPEYGRGDPCYSDRRAKHYLFSTVFHRQGTVSTSVARPVSIGPHFWGSITGDPSIPHSGVRSAGDSIYDKSLTGELILPSRTANQYLARVYRREPRTNIWPGPDIGSRFATVKLVHRSEIYHPGGVESL